MPPTSSASSSWLSTTLPLSGFRLYLLFCGGEVYRYFDVPRRQYQEFLVADSKGRNFGRNIRGRFRYERMRWPR